MAVSSFEEWWEENYPGRSYVNRKICASLAYKTGIDAAADLVYEMDFMANEHVAKLIRGLKDA